MTTFMFYAVLNLIIAALFALYCKRESLNYIPTLPNGVLAIVFFVLALTT